MSDMNNYIDHLFTLSPKELERESERQNRRIAELQQEIKAQEAAEKARQDAENARREADQKAARILECFNSGMEYVKNGNLDDGIKVLDEAINLDPNNEYAVTLRGMAYEQKGEHNKAINDFSRSIAINPKAADVYNFRGVAYKNSGEDKKAIDDFTKSLEFKQDDAGIYQDRGIAYHNLGDYEKAIKDYTKAISLNPKNADTYKFRSISYAQQGELDNAIADFTEAVKLNPKDDSVYNTRGLIYGNKKGDYTNAILDYSEAIKLNSKNPEYYVNRGDAYKQLGDKTKAIADYVYVLNIDPNNENAKRSMEELQQGEVKMSTQIFIDEINSIQKKFSGLIASGEQLEKDFAVAKASIDRDSANAMANVDREYDNARAKIDKDFVDAKSKVDKDFNTVKAEIDDKYQAKIIQLESARDFHSFINESHQLQLQDIHFQTALSELDKIEAGIPQKFKTKYHKTAVVAPKIPDFQMMVNTLVRINKKNFPEKMVTTLMDQIESGRAFISDEKQKWTDYKVQTSTIANQEFEREKAEVDKKKLVYEQSNIEKYRTEFDALNSKYEADIAPLTPKYEADIEARNSEHDAYFYALNSEYEADIDAHRSEFERELNSPGLHVFDEQLLTTFVNLGGTETGWKEYTPASNYPTEVMLGIIAYPFDIEQSVRNKLREKMPIALSSGQPCFTLPFTTSMSEPLHLLVEYDKEQKDAVMVGIHSIILKLIRFMPPSSLKLTYIDPNDRGTNLGPLLKLAGTSADIFKKTYASKEDIAGQLKELETFVDDTSAQLAGVDNVYLYNADTANERKIPYQFIVINDHPDHFDNYAEESLQILLKNSEKCGISFIFTSGNNDSQNNIMAAKIRISIKNNGASIYSGTGAYSFQFGELIPDCDAFVESVKTVYTEGIKVDNRFSAFFNLNDKANYMESTKCVSIPFAVDSLRHRVSLELGGTQSVNALLSGRTGSGKSTTLHMLISSIVMNYHPDDVELWLVDYKKVEFAEYIQCLPPHVRLLGLERDPEFTFSLLDKIDKEFQRRLELFKSKGVSSITEYKEKFGVRIIPRIILIIDEFHQMTQAIKNEPRYVQILENILSEYRAFGLSCVFSDQAISDGLRGLTEKGKKQISIRIAMENDISEIRETLALDNSFYDDSLKNKIQRMGTGDVIFKRLRDDGEPAVPEKYKTILISREERIEVIKRAVRLVDGKYTVKDLLIIDGQKRGKYEESVVSGFEKSHDFSRQIPVFVGTPVNLDPCFAFALRKKTDSNLMIIGSDDNDMRASIMFHTIRSFKRQPDTKVVVFAHKDDEIYSQYQTQLAGVISGEDSVIIKFQDMCAQIEQLKTLLNPDNEKRILICWLGLEEIADEFSVQPEKRKDSNNSSAAISNSMNAVASLTSKMDALLNNFDNTKPDKTTTPTPNVSSESLYDARPDIQELFTKGSRYNLYSFVTFSSVKMIRQTKFVKLENFEHKIALSMSIDDSTTYLGRGAYASGLDNISAVYDDGSGKIRTFRPYIL